MGSYADPDAAGVLYNSVVTCEKYVYHTRHCYGRLCRPGRCRLVHICGGTPATAMVSYAGPDAAGVLKCSHGQPRTLGGPGACGWPSSTPPGGCVCVRSRASASAGGLERRLSVLSLCRGTSAVPGLCPYFEEPAADGERRGSR